jgi:mannosyltransferase OCH1-like enzyme
VSAFDIVRLAKHKAFVAYKRARWPLYELTEPWVQAARRRQPFVYRPDDFADTFLAHTIPLERETTEPVPRRIFCFWTGDNQIPAIRLASLDSMRSVNPDVDVVLVTPADLPDWELDSHPLHPAYEGLSYVHRADYLRCYFLNFHGGGYADIKPFATGWGRAFDRMNASDAWVMGYRNPIRLMTPNFADPRMERLMVRTSAIRLGQNAYVARPRTPISEEWLCEVEHVLTRVQDQLGQSPGATRSESIVPGYPLSWNEILAQVLDPLTLKYSAHVLYEQDLFYDVSKPYVD